MKIIIFMPVKTSLKILLISSLLCGSQLFAQPTQMREQIWLCYFNQSKFNDHLGSWLDVQLRTTDEFTGNLSQFLFRPGITYLTSNKIKLTAGYAYIYNFKNSHTIQPSYEHRLWQQFMYTHNLGKTKFTEQLRLEQRFRENAPYLNRIRINLTWQFPLSKNGLATKTLFGLLSNELHLQFGRNASNPFDQNRAYGGIGYILNDRSNLQFGYMNVYTKAPSGRQVISHCIRLALFQNLEFAKARQKLTPSGK